MPVCIWEVHFTVNHPVHTLLLLFITATILCYKQTGSAPSHTERTIEQRAIIPEPIYIKYIPDTPQKPVVCFYVRWVRASMLCVIIPVSVCVCVTVCGCGLSDGERKSGQGASATEWCQCNLSIVSCLLSSALSSDPFPLIRGKTCCPWHLILLLITSSLIQWRDSTAAQHRVQPHLV